MSTTVAPPARRRVGIRLSDPSVKERGAGRWPLSRVFAVGASAVAVLAVLAIVLGALALAGLTGSRAELLDRVTPAREAAQRLSIALLDQETGVRGFSISGREEFLDPYRAGITAEADAVSGVRALAADDALLSLGPRVDDVERAAELWRTSYAEPTIIAVRAGPGVAPPDPSAGRALFDLVRARSDVLLEDLVALQGVARDRVAAAAAFLLAVAVGIAAVLIAVLVLSTLGLRRLILRPVSDLARQVREVVSGEVNRSVRSEGPREIVQLGEDVEAMRIRILGDLDAVQEANRQLDEKSQELERSNRDLEQFAYVASHDLQEPLRKVSSFCQLLQRRYGGQLDERADQYIEFAVDGAQRMQQLIQDLLAFSRVGRTSADFRPVPLDDAAAGAATQLEAMRAEVGGEIVLGALPVVSGDATLLRQLLVNLVGNGLKFHREGVAPVVEVSAVRSGDQWEITVADNGIGIDPEYEDKVFVIFQRLHGREVYPGTGIGLALAKKIVEFHGGRIRILPPDGAGAKVRVTLPAVDTEETPV